MVEWMSLHVREEKKWLNIGAFHSSRKKDNRERSQFGGAKRRDFTGFWELPRVCRQTRKNPTTAAAAAAAAILHMHIQPTRYQNNSNIQKFAKQHATYKRDTHTHTQIVGLAWLDLAYVSNFVKWIERKKWRRCCNKAHAHEQEKSDENERRGKTNHTWACGCIVQVKPKLGQRWSAADGGGVRENLMNIRINKTI